MSDNHDQPQETPPDVLILKLTRTPWRVDIGGTVKEVDLALAMLNQAVSFFEMQRYFASVAEMEKRAIEQHRVDSILGRTQ